MRAASVHQRIADKLSEAFALAGDADDEAIATMLRVAHGIDAATMAFLCQARGLVLDLTAALTSIIDTHRHTPYCHECGTRELCRTICDVQEILGDESSP